MAQTVRTLCVLGGLLALVPWVAMAQEGGVAGGVSGQLRGYWNSRPVAERGPVAMANQLSSGTVAQQPQSAATVQAEVRVSATVGATTLHSTATLQAQRRPGGSGDTQAWFNEVYAAGSALGWQWSAGKKVVAWDVGYAFRPNDMVQQEQRRTLASEALLGRPVVMAEHFNADTAWSVVWVNPTTSSSANGSEETALAARVYRRAGAVDWHGFARHGENTGTSLGMAASWVATDALELHVSARAYKHIAGRMNTLAGTALASTNPWQPALTDAGQQVLIGGTWTNEHQVSVMVEAWYDASALSDAQWNDWALRNQALQAWLGRGVPGTTVAGNLAWQANAFGVSNSLRRNNVFTRVSWQHERWHTALDVLYTPADRGVISTASVGWTGEQFKLEAGVRAHLGPDPAVVRQLPVQSQVYVVGSWAL